MQEKEKKAAGKKQEEKVFSPFFFPPGSGLGFFLSSFFPFPPSLLSLSLLQPLTIYPRLPPVRHQEHLRHRRRVGARQRRRGGLEGARPRLGLPGDAHFVIVFRVREQPRQHGVVDGPGQEGTPFAGGLQ